MNIYSQIAENLTLSRSFVLATIIKTSGHTPRDAGAKMLVYADGSIDSTIGGGKFEKLVIDDCLSLFKGDLNNLLKSYSFEESGPDSTEMICGGEALVFMELFAKPETLIIFGGGHVGRALVNISKDLNFKIVVIDNRPDILKNYQPPIETILTNDNYSDSFPRIDKNSYIVIVTHGHKYDKEILAKVINKDCAYIGMIGSQNKIAQTYSSLEKEGIEKSLLEKVYSPIGLKIGAEGPYEIAVSIAAELIAARRKHLKK